MSFRHNLFGGFGVDEIDYKAHLTLMWLTEKYGQPDCGRNRACFFSKHCVIKFPLNANGEADNDWEASCSGETLAKGRWIEINGFICVIQEKLNYVENFSYSALPDWVGSVDCGQVGYDKKGNLKAYDFGIR